MTAAATRPTGRISRTVIAGGLLVVLFALIAFLQWRRPQRQDEVIEQIRAAGGFVSTDPPPTLTDRISAFRSGEAWLARYTAVGLYTSGITGEWLREHDQLAALDITDLKLAETALTDDELALLVAAHPLHVVQLREEEIGEKAVTALAERPDLLILEVRDSPLGNEGLARLPLEQFEELRLHGTRVTPRGLEALRRAGKLQALTLDGRQLDAAAAEVLSSLAALRWLELFGRDVSDEHLQHLHTVARLESIQLTRTSVTSEGVSLLKATLPKCDISVR